MPSINYLKYLRITKGMLQKDLAILLQKSPFTVRRYENSTLKVSKQVATELSVLFEVSHSLMHGYIKKIYISHYQYRLLLPNLPNKLSHKKKFYSPALTINNFASCHSLILRKFPKSSPLNIKK